MLPSGNDAAIALAETFGEILFYESRDYEKMIDTNKNFSSSPKKIKCTNPLKYFL